MNKSSAILLATITFIGGLALGHIIGTRQKGGVEVAAPTAAPSGAPSQPAGATDRYQIPVNDKQPIRGPKDALVTIVEFSDFQCPFCSRVEPTLKQIRDDYGNKVRIVWRNNPLPFHTNADPAAQLAMEAFAEKGNDGFWNMHDTLFTNQQALERENLESYAKQAGLDLSKVRAALDNKTHEAEIKADLDVAQNFGVRGTPNFFINGRQLTGARPYADFKALIDEEVGNAQKLVSSGTPASNVYAAITKDALTKVKADAAAAPSEANANTVYKVELTGKEPQQGPSDALVTIVEISDFQCPFCGRATPTVKQVEDKFGKDVRVVWWNNPLPFHEHAREAANAAMEAYAQKGNDGFWKLHALLFDNQAALSKDAIAGFAQKVGLNVAKVKAAMETGTHNAEIDQTVALARKFGATGTPSFFINGRNLRGAQPYPAFESLINDELAKAKKLVASGTPRSQVYKKTIENGQSGADAAAPQAAAQNPDANKKYDIPVASNAPFKGNANAKVVIQQFSDFQCPFCNRVEPTVDQIMKEYGDKVKIVWRNYPLPFHPNAMPAAQAAREVFLQGGTSKFWKYHDTLFQNQQILTRENLEKWAQDLGGIDMTKFKAALDQSKNKPAIDDDIAAVAKAGAQIGTPSFFINGTLVQGAVPFEMFKTAIDAALH